MLFRRRRSQSDFSREIEAHVALEADRLRQEGLSNAAAEAAARRAFGNTTAAGERFYESRRWLWWDEISRDLQYAVRALRHNLAFSAAAVLTLALGIGANTAIFSVIDAALLRPLPYPNPERIAVLYWRTPGGGLGTPAPADYRDYKQQTRSFETMAAYRAGVFNVSGQEHPERINGAVVTPDFFAVMGAPALLGRTLTVEQDKPGGARTLVLSYSLWQRRYGGVADVLGQAINVDGEPMIVVGVMPPWFQYPLDREAWASARFTVPDNPVRAGIDLSAARDTHYFTTIGRLRPGVSLQQAQAEGETIARRLKQQYKDEEEATGAVLMTLRDDMVRGTRPALLMLLAAVSLLLVIACANVANILLARGATRQKEMAIRGALGAGRGRLIRQLLTESALLALLGGGAGVLSAYFALGPLRALLPPELLAGGKLALDARVLLFTVAASLASAVLFGLFPARQAAHFDLNAVMKDGLRGSSGGSQSHGVRSFLVASEIALAAVLLIGAGLLLRSFNRVLAVSPGFDPQGVLTLQLSLPRARYAEPESRARFVRDTIERLRATPGVISAAAISRLPMNPGASSRSFEVKGRASRPDEESPDYLVASPDYFRSMGIRVTRGRAFTDRDNARSTPVVIVNQELVRQFWPNQDPIGQLVQVGGCGEEKDWCQVAGVVEDVSQHNLDQKARPAVYVPYERDPWPFLVFVVRTATDPGSAASAVEGAIHAVDKEQPVYNVRAMREVMDRSLSPRRVRMLLLALFAALALALATVGIYGVMTYSMEQRTREIGIRMALGADSHDVLRFVIGGALKISLAGVAGGIVLSLGLMRFLSTALYGVTPTDAATLLGTSLLLLLMALLASYIPARRAAHTDPLISLRAE